MGEPDPTILCPLCGEVNQELDESLRQIRLQPPRGKIHFAKQLIHQVDALWNMHQIPEEGEPSICCDALTARRQMAELVLETHGYEPRNENEIKKKKGEQSEES